MPEIVVESYRDRCYSLGSLFVGSTGGTALGFLTKIFDSKKPVDTLTIETKSEVLKKNEFLRRFQKIQLGGNYYYRVGGQVLGSMILYSYLECKFQGGWPRKSLVDVLCAGCITGGVFGLRGLPGGKYGAMMGAGGFASYAGLVYLLFRR